MRGVHCTLSGERLKYVRPPQEFRMSDEMIRLTATEAVARLRRGEVSPLELVEAAAARIAAVEPAR